MQPETRRMLEEWGHKVVLASSGFPSIGLWHTVQLFALAHSRWQLRHWR